MSSKTQSDCYTCLEMPDASLEVAESIFVSCASLWSPSGRCRGIPESVLRAWKRRSDEDASPRLPSGGLTREFLRNALSWRSKFGFQVCPGVALILGSDLASSKVCKVSATSPTSEMSSVLVVANELAQAALALSNGVECGMDKICQGLQKDAAAMAAGARLVAADTSSQQGAFRAAVNVALDVERGDKDVKVGDIVVCVVVGVVAVVVDVVGGSSGVVAVGGGRVVVAVGGGSVVGSGVVVVVALPAAAYRYATKQLNSDNAHTKIAALAGIIAARALDLSAYAKKAGSAVPAFAASYAAAAAAQLKALGVDTADLQTKIEALAALAPQTGVALSDCHQISTDGTTINTDSYSISNPATTNGRFSLPSGPFDIVQDASSLKLVYHEDASTSDAFPASCASLMGAGATAITPPLYLVNVGDGTFSCVLL